MSDKSKNWSKEYQAAGIPSSFREEPSGSILDFWQFLQAQNIQQGRCLDLGCGKGRNSFFFAEKGFEVHAIDFVPELVESINQSQKVQAKCQSITDDLPYPNNHFDFIFDIFCYKHQTENQKNYQKEVARTLKDKGYYFISFAEPDDGFYGSLEAEKENPKLVIDPITNVPSYLFNKEEIEKEFSANFKLIHYKNKKKEGPMHGKTYLRSTSNAIFLLA